MQIPNLLAYPFCLEIRGGGDDDDCGENLIFFSFSILFLSLLFIIFERRGETRGGKE